MKRFEMFAGLASGTTTALADSAHVWVYNAGEYLWQQGEPNRSVLFIEEGLAVTSRKVREGMQRIYGLHGPNDSMGIYAIWTGLRYPTDAQVLNQDLRVIRLDTDTLLECAKHDPQLISALLTEVSRFTDAFISKIDIVSAGTVTQRIARLVCHLVERYGVRTRGGVPHLPFRLTLEQIGRIVDSRFETVARILGGWKRQGWLSIEDEGFYVPGLDQLTVLLAETGERRSAYCLVEP